MLPVISFFTWEASACAASSSADVLSVVDISVLGFTNIAIQAIGVYKLLKKYNSKTDVTIDDIIEFHYEFEKIHPFQDGNGRVGRMIMFKECLKNNIMPFIVVDNDKPFYMRGLKNYKEDKMFLIDTIKHEQDLYESVCHEMLNFDLEDK